MVEIDYYSKYLKYKQKYLKQKNLQIGGGRIFIKVNTPTGYTNSKYEIDTDKQIKNELQNFLTENGMSWNNYDLYYDKKKLDIEKNFSVYEIVANAMLEFKKKLQ